MQRWGLRRWTGTVGLSGVMGRRRAQLEKHGIGIVVGAMLVEVGKTKALYRAMSPTPSSVPVAVAHSYV